MKEKLIPIIALFSFLALAISASFASAQIIWSLPTEVPFYISGNQTYENQTLIINIISPKAKTYSCTTDYKDIPLQITSNLNASCYYKLDNSGWIYLGRNTIFSKTLSINKGEHTLDVVCRAGNLEVEKHISFKLIHRDEKSFTQEKLQEDLDYEESLRQTKYGEWKCINQRLQRIVTTNGFQEVEYGQICGLELGASEKTSNQFSISYLWIFSFILFILILIAIILIVLRLIRQ